MSNGRKLHDKSSFQGARDECCFGPWCHNCCVPRPSASRQRTPAVAGTSRAARSAKSYSTSAKLIAPVQVTNLAGAGGGLAFSTVVNERNDDAELIVAASSATTTRLAQNAYGGATADQVRFVGAIGADPGVIVVAADSPFQTLGRHGRSDQSGSGFGCIRGRLCRWRF